MLSPEIAAQPELECNNGLHRATWRAPGGDADHGAAMPAPQLVATYERLRDAHRRATTELAAVLVELSVATIRDVLPDAHRLEVHGEFNEDWLRTLRIQRIVGGDGQVLFDSALGDPDARLGQAVDEVEVEHLDLLVDLTGDGYMGWREIGT